MLSSTSDEISLETGSLWGTTLDLDTQVLEFRLGLLFTSNMNRMYVHFTGEEATNDLLKAKGIATNAGDGARVSDDVERPQTPSPTWHRPLLYRRTICKPRWLPSECRKSS